MALKKVRFANMDPESVRFMAREIHILRRLDNPNVIKLEGLVTSRMSSSLYLVFEYMEHDLAGLAATPGIKFTEAQVFLLDIFYHHSKVFYCSFSLDSVLTSENDHFRSSVTCSSYCLDLVTVIIVVFCIGI